MTAELRTAAPPQRTFFLILVLVFVSGAAGLAYEISWSRQLGLSLGQTARSAAIVLAAYFMGMALGYALAGRASARIRRPLLGFAAAELAVGLWALVLPSILQHGSAGFEDEGTRAVASLLVLLPGTTALGASMPFVARAIATQDLEHGSRPLAWVYAVNLAGAVAGVALTSTWLLVELGVAATSRGAALLSIAVAVLAVAWGSKLVARPLPESARDSSTDTWTWSFAAAVSGFGTLAAQVLYLRLFSLVFHNSTYTFAAILFVVLLSLSVASVASARCIGRVDARGVLVLCCLVAAITLPASVWIFIEVEGLQYFSAGSSFFEYISGATLEVAWVLAIPMVAMGMVLPLSWELAGARYRPGHVVGRLTMANTLAGALGAIAASFVLLPTLDLWWSFAVVALAYLVLAVVVAFTSSLGRPIVLALSSCALIAITVVTIRLEGVSGLRSGEVLIERFSGAYGWIDVTRDEAGHNRYLRQNIHYGLGSRNSSAMELRQGHLPLLLHPAPRNVAFVGLATGITASAALDHASVETVTVVELVPEVVHAARYFSHENANLLDDARTTLIVGDGRQVLRTLEPRFDVIVSDLFVPWESKTGYLYTVEHFESVRQRLREDGLFCQWLAGWQVGAREFDIIAQSMRSVFPHVSIWELSRRGTRPLFALVGSLKPRHLDRLEIERRLEQRRAPAVSRDYVLRNADDLVEHYLGDWRWLDGVPLNTDERPVIEFLSPRTHRTRTARLKGDTFAAYHRARLADLPRNAWTFGPSPR